jgi:hypothetical protein
VFELVGIAQLGCLHLEGCEQQDPANAMRGLDRLLDIRCLFIGGLPILGDGTVGSGLLTACELLRELLSDDTLQ